MSYDSKKIRHADKYKFIMPGSLSRKRLNFIRKVQLGSTGQYKLVAAGSTIEDFLNCHRVMLKSQKKTLRHMHQRKLGTKVRLYDADKYKFIWTGSASRRKVGIY
jgi:hypothetical protein